MAQPLEKKLMMYDEKVTKSGKYYEHRKYYIPNVRGFSVESRRVVRRKALERRTDNVGRARNTLIRKVLANAERTKPLFLTLTYASNMEDRAQAVADFKQYVRLLRSVYGKMDYVYVLETQERGAWHIHVLIFNQRFLRIEVLRHLWNETIDEDARVNIKKTADSKHVAFYIAKYLGKEVCAGNKRLFSGSRGLNKPVELITPFSARNYSMQFYGECIYSGGYFTPRGSFVEVNIYYET